MNLLKDDLRKLYFKFLIPSLGSAMAGVHIQRHLQLRHPVQFSVHRSWSVCATCDLDQLRSK